MKRLLCLIIAVGMVFSCSSCKKNARSNTLTISGIGISSESGIINLYQEKYPEVELIINDYIQYGSEAVDHLNADILSNKAGDVLITKGDIDIDRLIDNDVLLNLEEDESFRLISEKLIPCVINSIKSQNGIFFVFPFFNIECFFCKSKFIEEEEWNRTNLIEIINKFSATNQNLFGDHSDKAFENIISECIIEDIKHEKFDNNLEYYINLIEACRNAYNVSINSSVDYANDYNYINENIICQSEIIFNLNDLYLAENGYFKDEISVLGTPEDQNTLKLGCGYYLSVLNNSNHKPEALNFIKTVFDDKYQKKISYEGMDFPVKKEAFDNVKELAVSNYIYDEYGNQMGKNENIITLNEDEINLKIPKRAQIERYSDLIFDIKCINDKDSRLKKIIVSELHSIWYEEKNVENIVDSIRKKVNIYMSEIE